ncbi:MAG: TIM barrel protein [Rhizobiaceae bacterium]|nr:TIM barrel protein [Rhizobiaceae bacterium]
MQGRLTPVRKGVIQEFPRANWENEFRIGAELGFTLIEWTLDQDGMEENPLMTEVGRARITALMNEAGIAVPSLTGDCFMQAPFWKADGAWRSELEALFLRICDACTRIGLGLIVVPLVDNGRLENAAQHDALVSFLGAHVERFRNQGIRVVFESDFEPEPLRDFIAPLDSDVFGINYDIGNSAALGYDAKSEFAAYAGRILNVHIKDRVLGGTTVPYGQGNADFEQAFRLIAASRYDGNFILQGARAPDGDDAGQLARYKQQTENWLSIHEVGA